nr:serine/threonine-protein phosphatase 6 regulatory ankyrin repeat subunit C-like [Aegilops tauschii subsp. strangulata]
MGLGFSPTYLFPVGFCRGFVPSLSEEGDGTTDKMGKDDDVSRAVVEDDTALLLAAVDSIKKAALGRLRNGSDAARILDQEMSNRLLHLACRHDVAECARLLLDGEYGITPASVDARDQLTRTPLHVAAEGHSKRCLQLLLSRNARTDVRLLDGTRLVALEVALMSRRVQVDWSPDNSVEDLLVYLQQKDLNAVRLLAEKTREVGEVAYRYAMEGRVAALAMLLLVAEERISAMVSVVIDGVRTKRSIYNSVVDEVLSIGEASARDGNEMRRKALLCEIQLLNQFGATSWRDQKVDRRSLPPLLRAAKAGDMNVTKMLLMGDVDVNETDPKGNTALHSFLSSSSSTQEPRIEWLLLKNGARVFQGNKLGLTPVHSTAAKDNYKALQSLLLHAQDCVDIPSKTKETPLFLAAKNGSLSCVRLLLRYGANPKAQNLRKQRPIDVATSQDMRFLLNSANVVPMNHGSMEKNHAMKKERHKELLDDDFDDYDNDDYYESYVVPKASVGHGDFRSSNLSAQGAKSKSHSAPKEGPKLSQHNDHWEKHDYTRKIFVGGLPLTVDDVYLSRFFSTEFGPVEEAMVITLKIDNRYAMEGHVATLAMLLVAEDRISATVIDGVRTKRSIYNSVVDEVLSIGEASARNGNEMRKVLLCEIQLLNQFGATSWRDRKVDRRSLPPLLWGAKAGDMNVTKMLLMGDVDVNETDPEGKTALHCCLSSSSSTQEPRTEWLLPKNGARVFQGNKLGLTPVHSDAAKINYKAVQGFSVVKCQSMMFVSYSSK